MHCLRVRYRRLLEKGAKGVECLHKMVWTTFGVIFALMLGLYAAYGHLTPGGAFLGSTVITAGIFLPFVTPGARKTSTRVAGRQVQKIEILGLLIFILMAVIMLTVGAALFVDWLAEPGAASTSMYVDPGWLPGLPGAIGAIPAMDLVFAAEVIGGLSLIALYMLPGIRRGA